jgi:crotonobetainyl-CoA:carnitine CoA-transferase CaiB-like acyl-CoA transferase
VNRPPIADSPATLKVLDLGIMIAGPVAATILGDLGAEVIKIEKPRVGDLIRHMGPGPAGMSRRWQVDGRNKRSVELDIRTPEGRDIVRRLAQWADVLIENMRPGILDRYGLGYRQLHEVNPRLVYVSSTGFGQTGPLRDRPGYDFTGGAFGGLTYSTGFPDRPPVLPGVAVVDHCTGLFALIGALEALRRRDAPGGTGTGDWIDVGLYEPMLRMAGDSLANAALDGVVLERSGSVPMGDVADNPHAFAYETVDGHFVSVYSITDEQFARFRALLADPVLDGAEHWTIADRARHAITIDRAVRAWTARHDRATVLHLLTEADVPHSVINSAADILADPHVAARGNLVTVDDFQGNPLPMQGVVPRLHHRPGSVRWSGEPLGASTRQVLSELLGMSAEDIDKLVAAGVAGASAEHSGEQP